MSEEKMTTSKVGGGGHRKWHFISRLRSLRRSYSMAARALPAHSSTPVDSVWANPEVSMKPIRVPRSSFWNRDTQASIAFFSITGALIAIRISSTNVSTVVGTFLGALLGAAVYWVYHRRHAVSS